MGGHLHKDRCGIHMVAVPSESGVKGQGFPIPVGLLGVGAEPLWRIFIPPSSDPASTAAPKAAANAGVDGIGEASRRAGKFVEAVHRKPQGAEENQKNATLLNPLPYGCLSLSRIHISPS